jgi:hypothetical protein
MSNKKKGNPENNFFKFLQAKHKLDKKKMLKLKLAANQFKTDCKSQPF